MDSMEQTGEKFDLKKYLNARTICMDAVGRIANQFRAGMVESEGQQLVKEEFKRLGVNKFWHPCKVRIGTDTKKNFRAVADQECQLDDGELFFLDVGPIIDEHEADYGETFLYQAKRDSMSEIRRKLKDASIEVWKETAEAWRLRSLSGIELYKFAAISAEKRGFKLNPFMGGHRLGDFPHSLFSKEKLNEVEYLPSKNLWVLEIHLLSEKAERGAFFEDILV